MLPLTPKAGETSFARHYFPTFDALRLLAFIKTYLTHLQVGSLPVLNQLRKGSGLGVSFFFVLSGFLITYLACGEKQATGRLDLRRFFKRRMLRIWPLYYVVVSVGLAIPLLIKWLHLSSSTAGYHPTWWVSMLFLDNYKTMWLKEAPSVSMLSVLWTLCVEEHFYLVWGLLMYFLPIHHLKWLLVGSLVLPLLIRLVYQYYGVPTKDLFSHLDLFAWGGIPALALVRYRTQTEAASYRVPVMVGWLYFLFAAAVAWQLVPLPGGIWYNTFIGMTFSGVLFLLLAPQRPWQLAPTNILCKLGVYTYSLYMWHELAQGIIQRSWQRVGWSLNEPAPVVLFIFLTLLLCFVFAWLSFRFIELPFLRLRSTTALNKVKN